MAEERNSRKVRQGVLNDQYTDKGQWGRLQNSNEAATSTYQQQRFSLQREVCQFCDKVKTQK